MLLFAVADTFGKAATGSLLGRWVGVQGAVCEPQEGAPRPQRLRSSASLRFALLGLEAVQVALLLHYSLSEVRLRSGNRVWVLAATYKESHCFPLHSFVEERQFKIKRSASLILALAAKQGGFCPHPPPPTRPCTSAPGTPKAVGTRSPWTPPPAITAGEAVSSTAVSVVKICPKKGRKRLIH